MLCRLQDTLIQWFPKGGDSPLGGGGIWDFLGGIGYVVNFHFFSSYMHTFGKIDY